MANSVYQYEQPRCPDGWNESERRFYTRLIEVLDDIYRKYGRIDEKMLSSNVINRIDSSTEKTLETIAGNIVSAERIAADSIEATFAYVMSLTARYGSFDFETVKNLVAQALVVERGQGDYVHVTNLAATHAQMVNATIGNLCIGSDGKYFELDVAEDGTVKAREVELSDSEIAGGSTTGGKPIVGTNISAEILDAETVAASLGLFNKITASMIDTDVLVAREAFINALTTSTTFAEKLTVSDSAFIEALRTSSIVGDTSIEMIADATSVLTEQQAATKDALNRLSTAVLVDSEGVHVYRPGYKGQNEVRIDEDSVDVLVGGAVYTSFIPRGMLVGNYRMWQPDEAGGLAFNLVEG